MHQQNTGSTEMNASLNTNLKVKWTPRAEFARGAQATIPLVLGAIPFGLIFGALAATSGLSNAATVAMSGLVFAGASQFISLGLISAGTGVAIIILTTFVVNLRHALYSATLAPYLRHLPQRWLVLLGFLLTDETFVVAYQRYATEDASPNKHWFHLGSAAMLYINWQVFTWVGIVAGQSIPNPQAWGLDFAMPVTFIGMLVTGLKSRSMLLSTLAAGAAALVFAGLPNRLGLLVAALAGVAVGMLAARFDPAPARATVTDNGIEVPESASL